MNKKISISNRNRVLQFIVLLIVNVFSITSTCTQSTYIDKLKLEYTEAASPADRFSLAVQLYIDISFIDSTLAAPYIDDAKDIIVQHPTVGRGPQKISKAFEHFFKNEIDLASKTLDDAHANEKLKPIFQAHGQRLKGIILFHKDKPLKAKRFFQNAKQIYLELDNKNGIAHCQVGLGNIARKKGRIDLASDFYEQSSLIFEQLSDVQSQLFPLHRKAATHLRQGDTAIAQVDYQKILHLLEENNITSPMIKTHVKSKLALILDNQGKTDEAKILKEEVYEYASDNVFTSDLPAAKYSKNQGTRIKKYINTTAQDWEAEVNKLKVKQLETENDLKAAKILTQRLIVGIALLLCSLLGFYTYKIRKKNTLIKNQNKIIQTSLSEKETLLKEIHHRVKNNLQVVSSLLRIQSNETNDEGAINALREGRSRVHSMSLIHQSLYQKDNLTGIKMKDYMERLITSLFNTYNINKNDINLKTSIADINLDIETVVPLGLIINELITNALKYAFPNGRKGTIDVTLVEKESELILTVKDNGTGYNQSLQDDGNSFGSGLIEAFAMKLDANLAIESEGGTSVTLSIGDYTRI